MRFRVIAVMMVIGLAGCASLTGSRDNRPAVGPAATYTPRAQDLVRFVNDNAARVESIEAGDLALDVSSGGQGGGLTGTLHCEKPKNFRLRAKSFGSPVADFGSNNQEFWYWISKDNPPYLYHCSYSELARGDVSLPFPFQPDWVLECLGMATLSAPIENFHVDMKGKTFELSERATSASGRPVTKVTVFTNGTASGVTPQIIEHRLLDERGQLVALAEVKSVKRDTGISKLTIPQHVKLKWPQQKLEMELKLNGLKAHPTAELTTRAPDLFRRESLRELPGFDLATRSPDGRASGLQRTSGGQ